MDTWQKTKTINRPHTARLSPGGKKKIKLCKLLWPSAVKWPETNYGLTLVVRTEPTVDRTGDLFWQRIGVVGNIWLLCVIEARGASKDPRPTRWGLHYALPSIPQCSITVSSKTVSLSADDMLINSFEGHRKTSWKRFNFQHILTPGWKTKTLRLLQHTRYNRYWDLRLSCGSFWPQIKVLLFVILVFWKSGLFAP